MRFSLLTWRNCLSCFEPFYSYYCSGICLKIFNTKSCRFHPLTQDIMVLQGAEDEVTSLMTTFMGYDTVRPHNCNSRPVVTTIKAILSNITARQMATFSRH
jgi:hypothetical protein